MPPRLKKISKLVSPQLFKGDKIIWITLGLLSLLSLLIVYSTTGTLAYRVRGGNTLFYLVRQIFFLLTSGGIMLVMIHYVPIRVYATLSKIALLIGGGLVLLSFAIKLTSGAEHAGRTLHLGFISFQPVEFTKIALIIFTAHILAINQATSTQIKKAFLRILLITAGICGIIFFVEFSSALILGLTIFTMLFIGRVPIKYLLGIAFAGILLVVTIYFTASLLPASFGRVHTVAGRINRFINHAENIKNGITQDEYAQLAIYQGGLLGKGPGDSDVRNYMAAAYNDFIYAIIIEEFGLIGGVIVPLLYLILLYRSILIIQRSNKAFGAFMTSGLVTIHVYQAMVNMGVSVGILPVTGQPLPWVSLGGTSLLFSAISFGCVLSVSYKQQKETLTQSNLILDEQ